MENSLINVIVIGIFLLLLVGSVVFYLWSKVLYEDNRIGIRKIYYGVLTIAVYILWATSKLPLNQVNELLVLVVSAVLIDLFIFQTPDITKIFNAELKQNDVAQNIKSKRATVIKLNEKIQEVNRIMPKANEPWSLDGLEDFDFSSEKYEQFMLNYLNRFTEPFKMNLYMYYVESAVVEDEFKDKIREAYEKIRKDHDFSIKNVGMRKKVLVSELEKGDSIEILEKDCSYVLFPFFGVYYNHLFVISTSNGYEATASDASLLVNMLYTAESWLVSHEAELIEKYEAEYDEAEPEPEAEPEASPANGEAGNGDEPVV